MFSFVYLFVLNRSKSSRYFCWYWSVPRLWSTLMTPPTSTHCPTGVIWERSQGYRVPTQVCCDAGTSQLHLPPSRTVCLGASGLQYLCKSWTRTCGQVGTWLGFYSWSLSPSALQTVNILLTKSVSKFSLPSRVPHDNYVKRISGCTNVCLKPL